MQLNFQSRGSHVKINFCFCFLSSSEILNIGMGMGTYGQADETGITNF